MIYEIMKYCRNFFLIPGQCRTGEYTISNHAITLSFLADGQYFLVSGSVFNDGVYKYSSTLEMPHDETFTGDIAPLAVPKDFSDLCAEIKTWQTANGNPGGNYTSESFNGYSYQKAMNADGSAKTWKEAFKGRLKVWKKI